MKPAEYIIARINLDSLLGLWLEAIGAGNYEHARRLMEWRTALRQKLAAHTEPREAANANGCRDRQ